MTEMSKLSPQQGQIWLVKWAKSKETKKSFRPVLIISNNLQNRHDEEVIVLPLTTKRRNPQFELFFEISLAAEVISGLERNSWILTNRLHSVDKQLRLVAYLGEITPSLLTKVLNSLWQTFTLSITENNH
jgi:mRNA-degrading endonuclease toxin of MazEF toxin-antitoxin module